MCVGPFEPQANTTDTEKSCLLTKTQLLFLQAFYAQNVTKNQVFFYQRCNITLPRVIYL